MNRNHPFHDLLKPFGIRIDSTESRSMIHVISLLTKPMFLSF